MYDRDMGNAQVGPIGPEPVWPRLGILFVTSGWFRDVGLQSADSETSSAVEETASRLVARIGEHVETVFPGVLFSTDEAGRAGRELRAADVDAVLLAPLMWCEDQIVRAALVELEEVPIVLWTFSPQAKLPDYLPFQTMLQGSGAVCTLQLSGMLKRERREYSSVVGPADDTAVYAAIHRFSRGFALRRRLRRLRVGVLPFRCEEMSTTFVDEFELRRRYGVGLTYLEVARLSETARECSDDEIAAFRTGCIGGGAAIEVDTVNLEEGIRYALALEKMMAESGLDVLAMNDVIEEMHSVCGLRPCLANPRIGASGKVVSMEADIAAGIAMAILLHLSGSAPFYAETFSADYVENCLLLGHAGFHDVSNADPSVPVRIVNDVEYQNSDRFTGAATYFKFMPGPVTIVNSVWSDNRLKWVIAEGDSVAGPAKLEGNCHALCRLDVDVREFYRRAIEDGVSQHWIVVPGRLGGDLEEVCPLLDIGLVRLQ